MGSEPLFQYRCPFCGEVAVTGGGHEHDDLWWDFVPEFAEPPTITIPVAEYEDLKKRAGFWGAVDWDDVQAIVDGSWRSSAPHVIYSRRRTTALALRAAIKEQEG